MAGLVYLVGAGPGDPGLLTLRGAEVLARADVVVHDRLVHPSLLDLAPAARRIDVGKRPGAPGPSQEEINAILVREASGGGTVVRLKGGDPFVFGRGGEECEALREAGLPYEVVPGVTSAVAALTYAGIPLTHRDHASWAAVATGHERPDKDGSALDWSALARAGTAVFLMGVRRLPQIADELAAAGKPDDTPVAVVSWGTWPRQRVLRSTLGRVAEEVREAGLEAPSVLVVGSVARLDLGWLERRPLLGRRVFVTRARAQAGKLSAALRELGAEPLEHPAISIADPESWQPLDDALAGLASYDWVVVTSQNTVDVLDRRLGASGRDARAFAGVRIAAIGPATAERLRSLGLRADLVPERFTGAAVAEAFPAGPGSVLIPRAAEAPDELPRLLEGKGWRCDVVPAYRTVEDAASVEAGRAALEEGVDAVLFTAGSTVRNFVRLWGKPPGGALVCCIGPVTADVARSEGLSVDAVASEHTIDGLVAALVDAVGG